jgi:hypothetical protein
MEAIGSIGNGDLEKNKVIHPGVEDRRVGPPFFGMPNVHPDIRDSQA